MRTYKIAAVPGDGIGSEVIGAGCELLETVAGAHGFKVDFEHFDWGSDYYRKNGVMMPAGGVDRLRAFDAIYFGAVGDPEIPDAVTLWGLRLAICQGLDQYANVRPTRLLPGLKGPLRPELGAGIDWVIVRENSEGEYAGIGGRAHAGLPIEVGMDVAVFTREGVERICRFACELARSRPRKKLTIVTDRFLKVSLHYLGHLPRDAKVREAVRAQKPFVELFPNTLASQAIKKVTRQILALENDPMKSDLGLLWRNILMSSAA